MMCGMCDSLMMIVAIPTIHDIWAFVGTIRCPSVWSQVLDADATGDSWRTRTKDDNASPWANKEALYDAEAYLTGLLWNLQVRSSRIRRTRAILS